MRDRREQSDARADVDVEVDVDVDVLMQRIRERAAPDGDAGVPPALADPEPDLATLHQTSDVESPGLASHRRIFGPAVLFVKRLLLRFLKPSLESQARHNAATTRLLTHNARRLESLERRVAELSARLAERDDGGRP